MTWSSDGILFCFCVVQKAILMDNIPILFSQDYFSYVYIYIHIPKESGKHQKKKQRNNRHHPEIWLHHWFIHVYSIFYSDVCYKKMTNIPTFLISVISPDQPQTPIICAKPLVISCNYIAVGSFNSF